MNFLQRLFGKSDSSHTAQAAKMRLQSALAQDRSEISPEVLDALKTSIVDAVSKHMQVDRERVEISVSREGQEHNVVANIPVVSTRPARPRASTRRTMRTVRTTNTK